jgi:3-methyladenine DNA glycosylase/8-oxoguanine DNA glycosylase
VATATTAAQTLVLLAADRRRGEVDVARHVLLDRAQRGAVAVRTQRGVVRRAEPGPAGPLILEAQPKAAHVVLEVWGPGRTPSEATEAALDAAIGWAGLRDDLDDFDEIASANPVTRRLLQQIGEVRLSRLPRVGEALGRAVLSQAVQGVEASCTTAQVVELAGTRAAGGLWAWPTARQIGAVDAWRLRRCGVSLRSARALHEGAIAEPRLADAAAAGDWAALDRRLRALPGCGAWTSTEARLALGDADAVSVGDYHHPALIGSVLGPAGGRRRDYDDAMLLELLAPFAPHRGRVVRLIEQAAVRGLVVGLPRRGPRNARSAHRYW